VLLANVRPAAKARITMTLTTFPAGCRVGDDRGGVVASTAWIPDSDCSSPGARLAPRNRECTWRAGPDRGKARMTTPTSTRPRARGESTPSSSARGPQRVGGPRRLADAGWDVWVVRASPIPAARAPSVPNCSPATSVTCTRVLSDVGVASRRWAPKSSKSTACSGPTPPPWSGTRGSASDEDARSSTDDPARLPLELAADRPAMRQLVALVEL